MVSSHAMTEGGQEAVSAPQLTLRIMPSQGTQFDHVVESDSLVIGRSSTSDLVLPDRFLSRRHTEISRDHQSAGAGWQVADLGSHNGTLLNGRRLEAPAPLQPGDVLVLSSTTIRVHSMNGRLAPDASNGPSSDSGVRKVLRDATVMLSKDLLDEASRSSDHGSLRQIADRLHLLNEIHDALGRSVSLEELFELILDRVFAALRPEQAWILVKDEIVSSGTSGDNGLRAVAVRSIDGGKPEPPESRNLADEVMGKRMAALVVDAETDERFAAAQSLLVSGIKSLLAVPLLAGEPVSDSKIGSGSGGGALGMIVLSSRAHVKLFAEDDMELLVSLASVAALRIRNVALAEEAAERRRLEKELALARRIQERLLPDALPELDGWQLHAHNVPSRGVSGDYYTLVLREIDGEPRLSVMIADVSGKGMAASLLTASLEALCAGPIEEGTPPEVICEQVSRRLFVRTPPEKYATALVADVDPVRGVVRFCNAGHNPGLLVRRSGDVERLGTSGPPIGLMPGLAFSGFETTMKTGDLLVLYTDGITEAENPDEEEFGIERLEAVCREHRTQEPGRFGDSVGRCLDEFAQGVPFADDRTLVVLKRVG